MSFNAFIQRMRDKREILLATIEQDAMRISRDITGQIKLRVQGTGRDYNEQLFTPYSPQYKEQKAKLGYQTDHVDLTKTGRLWANVRPTVVSRTGSTVTISIGAKSRDNEQKVRGFIRRRPNPMLPTKNELYRAKLAYFQLREKRFK